ncbi:hypothetical protein [Streptomyces abyssomicinicus]|uniref:hypothetical protein n=1 Tax=Streptomyces abyssomicinicus TaxID=574929 RepID=UPI00350E4236
MLLRKPSEPGSTARDGRRDSDGRRNAAGDNEDNPFAPPPENQPSQEGRWSDRQPESGGGGWAGWGQRPGGPGQGGQGPGPGQGGSEQGPGGSGLRWDPTDPAQRRARYSLLSGTWGLIFTLFGLPWLALLLGALALHWGISALRSPARPKDPDSPAAAAPATPAGAPARNPQRRAAIIGIVSGSIALLMVALLILAQQVFLRDFFVCTDDALTRDARQACVEHLPEGVPDNLRESLTGPS